MTQLIDKIIDLHHLALTKDKDFIHPRSLIDHLRHQSGPHYVGIVGPRGVGKTILLKQLAAAAPDTSLYISLDTIPASEDLFETITRLNRDYGYKTFLLDEVYSYPHYDEVLKKMYDFLSIRVCFTSSIALKMKRSAVDLSRRVILYHLPPFSFREFLFFKHGWSVPALTFDQIADRAWTPEHMRAGIYFDAYLTGGLMPFALREPAPLKILANILDTIVDKDIAVAGQLPPHELLAIKKMVEFIGLSGVDGINYTSISNNLKITKYKAEQYLELLEDAFVAQRIFPAGTNVTREPKVLLSPPYRLLYRNYADAAGGLREDYFASAMRALSVEIQYLKSTRGAKTPDYCVNFSGQEKIVIEIGGSRKGRSQFKNFKADRKYIFSSSDTIDDLRRPLFMLGYLER
jgi:predicted AAA+ superfamily ATPase